MCAVSKRNITKVSSSRKRFLEPSAWSFIVPPAMLDFFLDRYCRPVTVETWDTVMTCLIRLIHMRCHRPGDNILCAGWARSFQITSCYSSWFLVASFSTSTSGSKNWMRIETLKMAWSILTLGILDMAYMFVWIPSFTSTWWFWWLASCTKLWSFMWYPIRYIGANSEPCSHYLSSFGLWTSSPPKMTAFSLQECLWLCLQNSFRGAEGRTCNEFPHSKDIQNIYSTTIQTYTIGDYTWLLGR